MGNRRSRAGAGTHTMTALAAVAALVCVGAPAAAQPLATCGNVVTRLLDASPTPTRSGLPWAPTIRRFGDFAYFSAFRPADGWTLWRTTGFDYTTTQVATLSQLAEATVSPQSIVATTPTHLYFTSGGSALWRTDGTAAGTALVDAAALGFQEPLLVGDRLLYRTSTEVRIIGPADAAPTPLCPTLSSTTFNGSNALEINGRVVFGLLGAGTTSELWVTDGTPTGTARLAAYDGGANADAQITRLYRVGSKIIYRAGTPETGVELFATDGTPAGTGVFHEFLPGPTSYFDTRILGLAGDRLYVNYLTMLAVTDGTTVTDLDDEYLVRPLTVAPDTLARAGTSTLFAARIAFPTTGRPQTGSEPLISDGTPAGTGPLGGDFIPGSTGAFDSATYAIQFGERTVFAARAAHGSTDLYITDGTPDNTVRLVQGGVSTASSMHVEGGRVFFVRGTTATGAELWLTDGTPQGTRLVKDIWPGADSSSPSGISDAPWPIAGSNGIFFTASTPQHGRELWYSDGTEAGTVLVVDIAAGSASSNVATIGRLGSGALFGAAPTSNVGAFGVTVNLPPSLQVWDGSPAPGRVITDVASGDPPTAVLRAVAPLFESAVGTYFLANSALYKTDGTDFGTIRLTFVQNLVNATQVQFSNQQEQGATVAQLGDLAVFPGLTVPAGGEPAITDGTPSGASIIRDIVPGAGGSSPANFTPFRSANKVIFRTTTTAAGTEPWVTDGTFDGTFALGDLFPGQGSGLGSQQGGGDRFVEFGGRMYFYARTGSSGTSIFFYSTDGTPGGTGPINSGLSGLIAVDTFAPGVCERGALFWGSAIGTGAELYVTDNTPTGTSLVRDVTPGPVGTGPRPLTSVGRFSTFVAAVAGQTRVWFTDGTSAGTRPLNVTINGDVINSVGVGAVEAASAPEPRRTFFVARTTSGRAYVCWFTTQPEAACVLAEITPAPLQNGLGAPLIINNRLFLAVSDAAIGAEPLAIDLCAGDFNNSGGSPTVQDIFDYVTAFFAGEARADTDRSGAVGVQDIFDFMTRWFAGCATGGGGG